ncbi:hypothetical protein [Mucilaginibacter gotjawali]|uniref:Uncharacterized protein n=2 Tax=Mucilaginibacter gotjawali TaxID=1550579 RepID=A0A839SK25_9SPHI|nr:hypothetical protein [Mucilaginibacter gotjawali]MBB3057230.1 hypothetical protein [Mucilaginibacter gotjawali]BAU53002.1 hypothetical protein MgSA37_01169 [Mucilaginibacter gotjawali]
MFESTQYQYSFKFSLGTLAVMAILMLLLLRNVLAVNSMLIWVVYGFCGTVFIGLSAIIIGKRLIPALKGDVALQLDDEGISDYIRDISINWADIKEITLLRGRSASTMKIELKFESDYGSEVAIPLRWIKGNDDEIYETTLAYFEQITPTDPS